jgi:hypothetical protein
VVPKDKVRHLNIRAQNSRFSPSSSLNVVSQSDALDHITARGVKLVVDVSSVAFNDLRSGHIALLRASIEKGTDTREGLETDYEIWHKKEAAKFLLIIEALLPHVVKFILKDHALVLTDGSLEWQYIPKTSTSTTAEKTKHVCRFLAEVGNKIVYRKRLRKGGDAA